MKKAFEIIVLVLFVVVRPIIAQSLSQTVKGRVFDKESQSPLIGVNVIIEGSDPVISATTDVDGNFKIKGVPLGRHTITASYIGYTKISIPEILVGSAKEVVINIELKEEISNLGEVVVTARKNKGDVMNSMSTVSSRSFNVEETRRYAGGFDDPARLASAFAGVSSNGSLESNAIIIRGNAPTGVMWQVEGVEVSLPSHFANSDVIGGGSITLFSNQVLSNSDFFTGAFPSEYGNATSGVFDVKLRSGNNENYEHAISVGVLGIDISSEGPFSKGSKSSYLFNYRYSTFGLVKQFLPQSGLPVYQDLSFKLSFPTTKAGTFTFWGIGGVDNYTNKAKTNKSEWTDDHARLDLNSWFYPGSAGIGHKVSLNNNTYIQSVIAGSSYTNSNNSKWISDDLNKYPTLVSNYSEYKYTIKTTISHKFSPRLTGRLGLIGNIYSYNYSSKGADRIIDSIPPLKYINRGAGSSNSQQLFTSVKYNLTEKLVINAGLHSFYLALNQKYSIEPRLGIRYNMNKRHSFGFAYGKHSQMQMLNIYLIEKESSGNKTYPNKTLDFTKSQHFVISYDLNINENMRFKIEPYYQKLNDIPVVENGSFSLINVQEIFGFDKALVSKGSGKNYGIDLTLERFLNKGYYYLATASLFESKYKGGDGIERNTMYNCNYIVNMLGGKEWGIGSNGKNNLLGINGRLYLRGGDRKNPVDKDASISRREVIYDETKAFSSQNPMLYRLDLSITYRINRPQISHVIAFQMNNILYSPTVYDDIYDFDSNNVREVINGEPFPSISWKVEF